MLYRRPIGLWNDARRRVLLGSYRSKQWVRFPPLSPHLQEGTRPRTPGAGEDVAQRLECSLVAGADAKWCSHFGRHACSFLQTPNTFCHMLQQSHAFLVLNWVENYVHPKTCIKIFVAALFIIDKTWNQPQYPSMGEWMDRLWYLGDGMLFSNKN